MSSLERLLVSGLRWRAAADRTSTRGAEVCSEKQWRTADADRPTPASPELRCAVEEGIDLVHPCLDGDELRAPLDHEAGAEPIALVHLQCETAQVTEALFAHLKEGLALLLQLSRGRRHVRRPGQAGGLCTACA